MPVNLRYNIFWLLESDMTKKLGPKFFDLCSLRMLMISMIVNCFCEMVDRQNALNFKCQPHKMVKHTQAIRRLLSVFGHFMGLALKSWAVLKSNKGNSKKILALGPLNKVGVWNFQKFVVKVGIEQKEGESGLRIKHNTL